MVSGKFLITRRDIEVDDLILESEGITIGRQVGSDLLLNHPSVSRTHAGIKELKGQYWIFNLSVNGTFVNGESVEKVPLAAGDAIQIGPYLLQVRYLQMCTSCHTELEHKEEPEEEGLKHACPKCGTLSEGNRFCIQCGFDLTIEAVESRTEKCPNCGDFRSGGARFCTQCGFDFSAPQAGQCPNCKAPRKQGTRFCTECGTLFSDQPAGTGLQCPTCGTVQAGQAVYALGVGVERQLVNRPQTMVGQQMGTMVASATGMRLPKASTPGTALLTRFVPPIDEQAVQIFWDKRKREAGKIATESPLAPKRKGLIGKAQFHWRPTYDLRRLWRKSYIAWGSGIAAILSVLSLFIYPDSYSPGPLSAQHGAAQLSARNIAAKPVDGSCTACHSIAKMQRNCESCHTTPTFDSGVSKAHQSANIGCIGCHSEHQGEEFRPGLVTSSSCVSCHNESFEFNGKVLGAPHGGTVGYPVENGKWVWEGMSAQRWQKKNLPGDPGQYTTVNQFHLLHTELSRTEDGMPVITKCTDCHATGERTSEQFLTAPKASCASCHAVNYGTTELAAVGPNCASCHEQHGGRKDLLASPRKILVAGTGTSGDVIAQATVENIPFTGTGSAEVARQRKALPSVRSYLLNLGGIPTVVWTIFFGVLAIFGFVVLVAGTARERLQLRTETIAPPPEEERPLTISIDLAKIKAEGPSYPYPVVDPLLCIGCHACVEACPHDVLAMVNGISVPVAPDQCMEDTGCTVECPTQPKACILVNNTRPIPPKKVPKRDQKFVTDVSGVYIIGDVAGVPLIKMAINEGNKVIDNIEEDIKEGRKGQAEYDVAVIGVGPGGLSAALAAHERGLKYLALEQEKLVSTIQAYPAGKYVFYKPDSVSTLGKVPLPGVGDRRENLLDSWMNVVEKYKLKINEEESCKGIKQEDGVFRISTESGKTKEQRQYTAQTVVIAIGNRGTPMKLGVKGEDIKIPVKAYNPADIPKAPPFCTNCGTPLKQDLLSMRVEEKWIAMLCKNCGFKVQEIPSEDYTDPKVKYKLTNPDDYRGKKCIVVGGGNSAIEAAVDLAGFKRDGEEIQFTRDNEVALVVRSDFKGDLKLGNKMNIYDCIDSGRVKVHFGAAIKEVKENEVILMNARSKEELATLPNDYIFALIGGEKPTKFLESIGIKIGG